MGLPILIIFLGLATLTIQKSVKLMDLQESPELEVILQNLLNQGLYKDVKSKLNPNKKSRSKDATELQYLGEISSEKDGKEGLKSLNKKLAKLLDGLQDSVMNENTKNPKCSCGYASKRWPGVIKCQCEPLSDANDEPRQAEDTKQSTRNELRVDERPVEIRKNEKLQDRRKVRSVPGRQERHIARFADDDRSYWPNDDPCGCTRVRSGEGDELMLRCGCNSPIIFARVSNDDDRDEGYWSDDNWCGCKLRSNKDGDNKRQNLRCRCNSPARLGKPDDRDEGYWSDDNWCGCKLLRSTDDDDKRHNLRCNCNSPARLGKDDREDGDWTNDNNCECKLLRDHGNGVKDLRCRCNSPSRTGDDIYSTGYNPRSDHYSAVLSDLDEEDKNYRNENPKLSSNEHSLNMLMTFILDNDDNLDLSNLPEKDRKILLKLKDLMPSLRNIDIKELKDNIETMLNEKQYPLRETVYKKKQDKENTINNPAQIQTLLQLIEEQKTHKNKKTMYRRSMPEETVGVPFTYEVEGLAQINT